MEKPLILITNDDGVFAPGLKALIDIAKPMGDIVVVAPSEAQSGMSHAITIKNPLRLDLLEKNAECSIYRCNGTPVDCVKIAIDRILPRKPDLLLSGINHGSNTSVSVFYSGTMAAAIEGCMNKIPSIGLSLTDLSPNADFTASKKIAEQIIKKVMEQGIPQDRCLNVNIPAIGYNEIKGIKICRMADGMWVERFEQRFDPNNHEYYWLTGSFNNYEPEAADTDEYAVTHEYVSIVPIHIDFTSYKDIEVLTKWGLKKE